MPKTGTCLTFPWLSALESWLAMTQPGFWEASSWHSASPPLGGPLTDDLGTVAGDLAVECALGACTIEPMDVGEPVGFVERPDPGVALVVAHDLAADPVGNVGPAREALTQELHPVCLGEGLGHHHVEDHLRRQQAARVVRPLIV